MIDLNKKELYELTPMKYYSFPASYGSREKRERLEFLLNTNQYIFSLKTDGNWARTIWQEGEVLIQSRSVSKKTGTYGEFQDKVFFTDAIKEAFTDTTMLLGEIYLEGGRDKDVGTILRCNTDKAIARQTGDKILRYRIFDCWYYNGIDLTNTPIIERLKYLPLAAAAINNQLVSYTKYYEAKVDTFFDRLNSIFEKGGEGVVLYHKNSVPCEGATPAWQTLKVKQEMEFDADCFIYGVEPAEKNYTGKEIEAWQYWMNDKTGEKFHGSMYSEYIRGSMIIRITIIQELLSARYMTKIIIQLFFVNVLVLQKKCARPCGIIMTNGI